MAIPTQFSVAKKRKCPLANPVAAPDVARAINAKSVGFISGASNIPAKDSVDISTPVTVTTVAPSAAELPSLFGSLSAPAVDDASAITAKAAASVDDAEVITPKAAPDVDGADVITAEAAHDTDSAEVIAPESLPDIDIAITITAEDAADIDSASALTAEAATNVDSATTITAKTSASIDDASLINAELSTSISTPTSLTASAGTQTSGTFPLNHARILYDNALSGASVLPSGGTGAGYTLIPNTFQRWNFTASGADSILFTMSENVDIDTICIGSHNLGDSGASIMFYYDANDSSGGFVLLGTITAENNNAIMLHIDTPVSARRIQINISGAIGSAYIGYISAGIALQMQRPFFNGHQPYTDSDVTEYYTAKSEAGNILNRDVRRKGFETSYEWSNIDDGWYRDNIPTFKEAAKKNQLFIAWNLLEYPNDVAFGMTTGDIKAPMQNGTVTKRGGFGFTLVGV